MRLLLHVLLTLAFPGGVFAQEILFLSPNGEGGGFESFRNEFSRLISKRYPASKLERRSLAIDSLEVTRKHLADLPTRPSVYVTAHTGLAQAAALEFPSIPVVLATLADPAQLGFPSSGGHNVTGFTFHHEFELKHFEFLRELDPRIQRVGVVADRYWQTEVLSKRIIEQGPALLGMEIEVFSTEEGSDPSDWHKNPSAARMDAWFVPDTPANRIHGAAIAREIRRLKRPSIGGHRSHAVGGGLVVYEPDRVDPWPRIARIVNLVLSGVPAREIAFDRPSAFRLIVNLKAATELGLEVPAAITRRADEIIR